MAVLVTKAVVVVVAVACYALCQGSTANAASGCFETGVDYYGQDVEMIRDGSVTTPEECQRRCQANDNCAYFTFFSDNNHCYLKNSSALSQRWTGSSIATRVSGPRSCACFEDATDYYGHDIPSFPEGTQAQTLLECQKICQDTDGCAYFTFRGHNCYLKDAFALQGRTSDSTTTTHVSGPKNCELTTEREPEEPTETPTESPTELPDGDSEGGIEFLDQSILKITATKSPAHFKVTVGSCYTVAVDKAAKEMYVEGAEPHKGSIPGAPAATGSFVLLIFHDGNRLAAVYDYQMESGEWATVTVRTPSSACRMSQVTISGVPSSEDFKGVRAFVTDDLKELM